RILSLCFMIPLPPTPPLFPYTTLFRSRPRHRSLHGHRGLDGEGDDTRQRTLERASARAPLTRAWSTRSFSGPRDRHGRGWLLREDRKSTRLNSSHEWISYAVFCLKKKR